MVTLAPTRQLTVNEFRQLPDTPGFRIELHNGEVIQVSPPSLKRAKIEKRIYKILEARLDAKGFVSMEVAFRAQPEFDCRIADVAFVNKARYEAADENDNFTGAPDLVVEVLSPSNTAAEMYEKERLCLATGALEFWVVDPNREQVRVSSQSGPTRVYSCGELIPLTAFDDTAVPVDEVFA